MEYRKVRILSVEESAYLAGIVDGEGTITLTSRNKGQNRRLVITVSNTERELLEWVLKVVGVGVITTKKLYEERHSAPFAYSVSNNQAYDLLKQIAPHLKSYKKYRANLALENYHKLTPRNGKYTPGLLIERNKFIQEFFSFRSKNSRVKLFDF